MSKFGIQTDTKFQIPQRVTKMTTDQNIFLQCLKNENWGPSELKWMVSEGFDVHAQGKYGMTFPHWIMTKEKRPGYVDIEDPTVYRCIDTFMSNGFKPNTPNSGGNTLLHQAILCDVRGMLGYLIKKGLDINARNTYGYTPLYYAVQFHRRHDTYILLKHGANPDVADNEGKTPLSICTNTGIKQMLLDPKHCYQVYGLTSF